MTTHVYVALHEHMYEGSAEILGVFNSYNGAAGMLAKKYPAFVTLPRISDEIAGSWTWDDNFVQESVRIERHRVS
jgi:hypothetical protein